MAFVPDLSGNNPQGANHTDQEINELLSAHATATAQLVPQGQVLHLQTVQFKSTGTAGTLVLRTGGSGGDIVTTISTPAVAETDSIPINGTRGLHFNDGIHATLTNVDGVTIFYDRSH